MTHGLFGRSGTGIRKSLTFTKLTAGLLAFLIAFGNAGIAFADETGTSKEVSTTPEGLKFVNNDEFTGAFSYDYEIILPPGRNGLTPSLGLTYSSGQLNNDSYVGYGWGFNIPSITRLNKHGSDKLYDYFDFTSSLSGELVKVSTTTYRAEVETGDFLDYTFDSNYWTVYDKSGTRYLFGQNAQARQDSATTTANVYRWMLEEVRDTNDNYISYDYYKDAGQIYPSEIIYTGHGSTDGIFTVEFVRTAHDTSPTMYYSAFPVKTSYRITGVDVKENDSWVRSYDLSYTTGDAGYRSLLAEIEDTGRDLVSSSTASRTFTFSYKDSGPLSWTKTTGGDWQLPHMLVDKTNSDPTMIQVIDVNGDAYPDVVYSSNSELGCNEHQTWINDAHGGWDTDCNKWIAPVDIKNINASYQDNGVRVFDHDGDFLIDLVRSYTNSSVTGQYISGSYFYKNVASSTANWILTSTSSIPIGFIFHSTIHADNATQVADVNGDGLADIMYAFLDEEIPGLVTTTYLGDGSTFSPTASSSWVVPGGFIDENSYENKVFTNNQWIDVNGDGLVEYVFKHEDGETGIVGINNGSTWVTGTHDSQLPVFTQGNFFANRSDEGVRSWDINGDGITDLIRAYYDTTPSNVFEDVFLGTLDDSDIFADEASSTMPLGFTSADNDEPDPNIAVDINADGMMDLLHATRTATTTLYALTYLADATPFTDMLIGITTSEGASSTISYKLSTQYFDENDDLMNPSLPIAVTTVNSIITDDGLGNEYTDTYTYADGYYYYNNPLDRKFAGFGLVTRTDDDGDVTKTYFHQGNSTASSVGEYADHIAKRGKPYRVERYDDDENLHAKTINKWDRYDRGSGASFVKLVDSVTFTYDGDSDHKEKAESFAYQDSTGLTSQKTEWGLVSGSNDGTFSDSGSDKFITTYSYATSTATSTPAYYRLSQETKVDQSSNKVRERKLYYDTLALGSVDQGNLTKEEQWKTGSTYIDVERTYDSYGLVTQEKDPRDKTTTYSYDSFNLYPATSTNALSQSTGYVYDYSSGKVQQLTDSNGHMSQTLYDPFDRVREEKQPDLATPSTLVTKAQYQYTDSVMPRKVQVTSYLNSTTSVTSYVYSDGLGRKVQEKIESEDSKYAAKDFAYNSDNLLAWESLPYFSDYSTFTGTSSPPQSTLKTTYAYDPLGKVLNIANVIGTTTYAYDDWKTSITDPHSNVKHFYKDAYGNLTKVEEENSTSTYSTTYEYDGNNKLTKLTDALDNVRNFTYDGLGRRLTAQDLHALLDLHYGTWTYTYDDSGNLSSTVDPNSQTINYTYDDINRQLTEDYTGQAGTEVTYSYDSCTNGVGRLCSAGTANVTTTYAYNPLGAMAQLVRTMNASSFQTDYTHDWQGNMLTITNPDASQVEYAYNTAGQLETVQRREPGGSLLGVVDDVDYGPHGKVTYRLYANNASTTNSYDSIYRLARKITTIPVATATMQDLSFTYDANSNITKIVDASQTNTARVVDYAYDDLNRLVSASSSSNLPAGQKYNDTYAYDALGNLTFKTGEGVYTYGGTALGNYANPHAVTLVSSTAATYDNNGNLTSLGNLTLQWDYKNRLLAAKQGASATTTYTYDHTTQRVSVKAGHPTTLYPTKYYNIATTSNTIIKHIYADDDLLFSSETVSTGGAQPYLTFSDHLGSTNITVNASSNVIQQTLDYFPFGEQRFSQGGTQYSEKHRFAGAELDTSDGLSYMQARYYKPTHGKWTAQDPVFWEVGLSFDGKTVLENPQALNSYSYSINNPVANKDPQGRCPVCVIPVVSAAQLLWAAAFGTAAVAAATIAVNTDNIPTFAPSGKWIEIQDTTTHVSFGEPGPQVPMDPKFPNPEKLGKAARVAFGSVVIGTVVTAIVEIFKSFEKQDEFAQEYQEKVNPEKVNSQNSTANHRGSMIQGNQNYSVNNSYLNPQQAKMFKGQLDQIQRKINEIKNNSLK